MAMTRWPKVCGEYETLEKLHEGFSVSRLGDGEISIVHGGAQVREPRNYVLARELRQVLESAHPKCLVGIPTLDPRGAKHGNWLRRQDRFLPFLHTNRTYYSAFISRPDSSGDDIRTPAYANRMVALWQDKRTALVSERDVAIFRLLQKTIGTGKMVHIPCPHSETYAILDQIETDIVRARPEIAILSCGPAATCLANRLAYHNIQAIDIGSAGGFLLKQLFGQVDTLKVFSLGPQRTGTTSLGAALTKAGFQVAHNRPKWLDGAEHTGALLTRAHAEGLDPVHYMPGVGAIVHPSVCIRHPEPLNLWPQMDLSLLESLRNHHPDCTFILNKRPITHWIRSVTNWKDFRQRITEADIPGLPPGVGSKDEELEAWINWHHERMRDFFKGENFIEINIENTRETEKILTQALGRLISWPWLNRG